LWDLLPFLTVTGLQLASPSRFRHDTVTTVTRYRPAASPSRDAAHCSRTAKGPTTGTFLCKCQLWDFLPFLTVTGLQLDFDTSSSRRPRIVTRYCLRAEMRPNAAERQKVPQLAPSSASANCGTFRRSRLLPVYSSLLRRDFDTTSSRRRPRIVARCRSAAAPSRDAAHCSRTAKGPTIGTFLCKCQLWDFLPLPIFLSPKYCLAWNGLSAEADTAASVGCVDWTAASGADVP